MLLVFKPSAALPLAASEVQADLEGLLPRLHGHFSALRRQPPDAVLEGKVTVTAVGGGENYEVVSDGPHYVVSECDDGEDGRR